MRKTRWTLVAALALAAIAPAAATAADDTTQFSVQTGGLNFVTAPDAPDFAGPVTVGGLLQTVGGQMNTFSVNDATGSGDGWSVTVAGDTAAGKSPVFAEYCTNATCGTPGYVAGGASLAADSLKLNTTGATWTAEAGNSSLIPPTYSAACLAGCAMDAASATKVASANDGLLGVGSTAGGVGQWNTGGWGAAAGPIPSLQLSVPPTTAVLDAAEVYRVDLLWSLNTGP